MFFLGSAFSQNSTRSTHLQRHLGATPHKCEICGKLFAIKGDLRTHHRIHLSERPFTCETCGKSFPRRSNYVRHLRKHTGEKPYACIYCEKRFARSEKCVEHQRIHTNERPFVCCECGASFADSGNFSKHKKMHKEGKQPRRKRQQTTSVSKSIKSFANTINSDIKHTFKRNAVSVLPKINPNVIARDAKPLIINLAHPTTTITTKSKQHLPPSFIANNTDVIENGQFIKLSTEHIHNTGQLISLSGENNTTDTNRKNIKPETRLPHHDIESNSLNNQAYLMLDYFSPDSSLSFSSDGQLLVKNSPVFLQSSGDLSNNENSLYGVPMMDTELSNHVPSRGTSITDAFFNRDNSSGLSSLSSAGQISLDVNHELFTRGDGDMKSALDTNTFLNDDYLIKSDLKSVPH